MIQYTNGFTCAMDNEKGEVIINFIQQSPQIEEDGTIKEIKVEQVASLVMGKVTAKNMLDNLSKMLEE